jgi:hypothetical protein
MSVPRMLPSGVPELRRSQCEDKNSPQDPVFLPITSNHRKCSWKSLTPFYRIGN